MSSGRNGADRQGGRNASLRWHCARPGGQPRARRASVDQDRRLPIDCIHIASDAAQPSTLTQGEIKTPNPPAPPAPRAAPARRLAARWRSCRR